MPRSEPSSTTRAFAVLGLTGAVGAGKSTVAALLAERGCRVIDVDALGHEALETPPVRAELRTLLGDAAFRDDGSVDRAAVARGAFADRNVLVRLEAAVHPVVRRRVESEIRDAETSGAVRPRAVVVDCALLFEGGLDRLCDRTVAVDAPPAVRAARVRPRGWDEDEIRRREALQLPAEEKRARADRVLRNDGTLEDLRRAVAGLLDETAPARPDRGPEGGTGR